MFILVVQFVYPWLCLAYRLLSHVFLSVKAMCSCVIAVESSRMSCAYISDVIISLAQLATPSHIQLSAKRGDITKLQSFKASCICLYWRSVIFTFCVLVLCRSSFSFELRTHLLQYT